MQIIPVKRPYTVMVDYAHSPDALEQVLRTLRAAATGQILTVFGCGGDRDRAKRPIMGRIAAELSEQVIITTDNPRTENPHHIIAEILAGTTEHAHRVRAIPDRTQAISAALAAASPGDLVLIAGKGSETYQTSDTPRSPTTTRRQYFRSPPTALPDVSHRHRRPRAGSSTARPVAASMSPPVN